jgi:hypothetical protein
MRINVYSEELTERIEFGPKMADTGVQFFGLQFFLRSPEELHHSEKDDDSSAVIFWSDNPAKLLALLAKATQEVQRFIESK